MDVDMEVTDREEVESFLKVLLIVSLEGSGPSFEFCFERHGRAGVPDAD
jgi:hypothetical protein